MRRLINILMVLILLTGVTIYCARLETFSTAFISSDAAYDAEISQDIHSLILDSEKYNKIISENKESNNDMIVTGETVSEVEQITEIFSDPWTVFYKALENHNNAKNLEIIINTGFARAIGKIGGTSAEITGDPAGIMQRSSTGEKYLKIVLAKMDIPYFRNNQTMDNKYYFSGAKTYIDQFGVRSTMSDSAFQQEYSYNIGDLISNINKDTVELKGFNYIEADQRYTLQLVFKKGSNGMCLGMENYSKFIMAAAGNDYCKDMRIDLTEKIMTFSINKNCQFTELTSSEIWDGSLSFTYMGVSVDVDLDLTLKLLWSFKYPARLITNKNTF